MVAYALQCVRHRVKRRCTNNIRRRGVWRDNCILCVFIYAPHAFALLGTPSVPAKNAPNKSSVNH